MLYLFFFSITLYFFTPLGRLSDCGWWEGSGLICSVASPQLAVLDPCLVSSAMDPVSATSGPTTIIKVGFARCAACGWARPCGHRWSSCYTISTHGTRIFLSPAVRAVATSWCWTGCSQRRERDKISYQEMIAFLPLCSQPNPHKVPIMRSGDRDDLWEVVKHSSVEYVVQ